MAELSFNHFGKIAYAMKPALQRLQEQRLLDLESMVKAFAPVQTGFLRDSVYVVLPGGSTDYGSATPPTDDVYLLPQEQPTDDMSGLVGIAANYGVYVNYGTRHMPANPFFDQAVEMEKSGFESKFGGLEDLLRGMI